LSADKEYLGEVVWFSRKKRYGFVRIDEAYRDITKREIFFHATSIKRGYKPRKGDTVVFMVREAVSKKAKATAYNIRRIG